VQCYPENPLYRRADTYSQHISNLCSAFSYCLTLLGTSYVWYGKGSLPRERQTALEYAQSLTTEGSSLVELIEQESDDNEFFWMMLGDAGYASADYWKWRPKLPTTLPRIWRVDPSAAPYVRVDITPPTSIDFYSSRMCWHSPHNRKSIRLFISLTVSGSYSC
jgi:hypothetical protein